MCRVAQFLFFPLNIASLSFVPLRTLSCHSIVIVNVSIKGKNHRLEISANIGGVLLFLQVHMSLNMEYSYISILGNFKRIISQVNSSPLRCGHWIWLRHSVRALLRLSEHYVVSVRLLRCVQVRELNVRFSVSSKRKNINRSQWVTRSQLFIVIKESSAVGGSRCPAIAI